MELITILALAYLGALLAVFALAFILARAAVRARRYFTH